MFHRVTRHPGQQQCSHELAVAFGHTFVAPGTLIDSVTVNLTLRGLNKEHRIALAKVEEVNQDVVGKFDVGCKVHWVPVPGGICEDVGLPPAGSTPSASILFRCLLVPSTPFAPNPPPLFDPSPMVLCPAPFP